jgi:predicted HicB family RNase H-like nuclease
MKKHDLKAKAARYVKIVEWSEEDRRFVGMCPGLMFGGIHGDDEARVYAELCQAVEEVIEILETDGHPLPATTAGQNQYSGEFVVHVDPALHRRLALKAQAAGESLNRYCADALARA